ncbi:MAG TPA: lipopolysaccharide transport periplasmic protein LptA [Nevskiaceae bacterium]|nr:lipopolysaccharide transport periplasmic protein LptA [Nevskiaceae bacterium]
MSCRAELLIAALIVVATASAAPSAEEGAQAVPQSVTPASESPAVSAPAVSSETPAVPAPAPAEPAPASTQSPPPPAAVAAQPPVSTDFRAKAHEYKSAAEGFHKPTGEITVTADHVEWQTGAMHYTGNVTLTVDTMEMRGGDLELKLIEGRLDHAHLTGEPARMSDKGVEGQPPISAVAKRVDYDPTTAIVELAGGAQLMRGADRLTGELIRYDVAARRVQAAGTGGSQVKIVIQPPAPPKSVTQP